VPSTSRCTGPLPGGCDTCNVAPRRLMVEWSGAARSRPSSRRRDGISPSVWRSQRRKTARSVSAVVIANVEVAKGRYALVSTSCTGVLPRECKYIHDLGHNRMHPSREALASLRGQRYWPPHDGVGRMRWNNLNIVRRSGTHVPCELTSSIFPARGALPPGRNSISLFRLLHWPPYAHP
jgi:hypothetical protein